MSPACTRSRWTAYRGRPAAQKALGPSRHKLFDRYPFGPVVDGEILPRQPFDPDATALSAHIPLLIGDMKDEAASFVATDDAMWFRTLDEASLRVRVAALAGDAADRVIAAYRAANPAMNPAELLIAIRTDAEFRIRSLLVAERQAALVPPRCSCIHSSGKRRCTRAG